MRTGRRDVLTYLMPNMKNIDSYGKPLDERRRGSAAILSVVTM